MTITLAQLRENIATLPDSLAPLSFAAPTVLNTAQQDFLRYYGIDLCAELPGLRHYWGMLRTPPRRLSAHLWVPEAARGSVVLLHGYFDHAGLYGPLLRHLLRQNRAVFLFDLPGHGLSDGAVATISGFDHYLEAFHTSLCTVAPHLPQPWRLLGQSTGGAIAMEWLLTTRRAGDDLRFADIVLLAPLVRPHGWRWLALPHRIIRHCLRHYPRWFGGNTNDADFIAFIRDRDPLQARGVPVQWVNAMQRWQRCFERHPPSNIKVRAIFGKCDRTIDWRHSIRVVSRLFDARVLCFDRARHHLANESVELRQQIYAAIDDADME